MLIDCLLACLFVCLFGLLSLVGFFKDYDYYSMRPVRFSNGRRFE